MQRFFCILFFIFYGNLLFASDINAYITHTWNTLTRTHKNLAELALDPKFPLKPGEKPIIYIAPSENLNKVSALLKKQMGTVNFSHIQILKLPNHLTHLKPGLLYLPYPYVVPGGRFNEMYGWDSYFIILGLLKNHRLKLAEDMVNNLIYEINDYGTILNANRSYLLQRSQPPLLTEAVLAVYQKNHDKKWLASTLPAIEKLYTYWTTPPHLIPHLGLSRYYANGNGPAIEVIHNKETHMTYYEKVKNYYKNQFFVDKRYFNKTGQTLTPLFYKNDRTVRESGFDLSNKFGTFGVGITEYAPVSLNTLLYKMEQNTATINEILGHRQQAQHWHKLATHRKFLINRYLWNHALGYYFDYNFITKQQRIYIFATTFYPLWAGVASQDEANHIIANLPIFENRGGIVTSSYVTGAQWDAPFGWAPLQYFAVEGLLNYGDKKDALRIAKKFNKMVEENFQRDHTIVEKYNVRENSSSLQGKILYGYLGNQVGFGWTNGVYLILQTLITHIHQ